MTSGDPSLNSTRIKIPERFRKIEVCADYRAYVTSLPKTGFAADHAAMREQLSSLGRAEPERLGVTYVKGAWGFIVIPPQGFPELKISFYLTTPTPNVERLLLSIQQILGSCEFNRCSTGGLLR